MSKKLEEKQRRRLADERRKAEAQRAQRRGNLITIAIAAIVVIVVVALVLQDRGAQNEPVGVAAQEAGCGEIETQEGDGRDHVPDGDDVVYETDPPTSGPHYGTPADLAFYTQPLPPEQLVHNLEHGQIVFWYDEDAPQSVIDGLEAIVDRNPIALLASPYDGIESPNNFVMTAWGASQACQQVSQEVIDDFRRRFQGQGPEELTPPFEG